MDKKILLQINIEDGDMKFIINETNEVERRALTNLLFNIAETMNDELGIKFDYKQYESFRNGEEFKNE